MPYSKILVVSDNEAILSAFISLLNDQPQLKEARSFRYACHPKHASLVNKKIGEAVVEPLDIKQAYNSIIKDYDLVISAHCKQIFPAGLIEKVKCINIHPGYNPYNRGWYPQVFSILNGLPLGATIHEIDQELDHGAIIARQKVELKASDTSLTAYNRVQAMELELLKRHLEAILNGSYQTEAPEKEGNVNYKQDFDELREIDLGQKLTFKEAIDKLRALSHPPYKNAYFIDPATGKKVWVGIELEEEEGRE